MSEQARPAFPCPRRSRGLCRRKVNGSPGLAPDPGVVDVPLSYSRYPGPGDLDAVIQLAYPKLLVTMLALSRCATSSASVRSVM